MYGLTFEWKFNSAKLFVLSEVIDTLHWTQFNVMCSYVLSVVCFMHIACIYRGKQDHSWHPKQVQLSNFCLPKMVPHMYQFWLPNLVLLGPLYWQRWKRIVYFKLWSSSRWPDLMSILATNFMEPKLVRCNTLRQSNFAWQISTGTDV